MPTVNLPIGKGVHAEGDDTSIQDGVSQTYINCYVDATGAVRRIPAWQEFCDLGTGASVDGIYHSRLHGKIYSVSYSTVFEISSDGTAAPTSPDRYYISYNGQNYTIYTSDPSRIYVSGSPYPPGTYLEPEMLAVVVTNADYANSNGAFYIETTLTMTGLFRTATDIVITSTDGNRTLQVYSIFGSLIVRVIASQSQGWTPPSGTEVTSLLLQSGIPVAWTENGDGVFCSARSPIYWLTGSATNVLPSNAPEISTTLGYIGGYLLSDDQSSNAVAGDTAYSDDKANGYATWEVYNNELVADALSSLVVQNATYVYNIGDFTIETSYVSGDPANVFATNKGRTYNFGALAKYSVCYDQENIYMLSQVAGSRRVIILPGGGEPQIISTPVDIPLEHFRNVTDARGHIIHFNGSTFYLLAFPRCEVTINDTYYSSITLAYHLQGKEWYIFGEWDGSTWSSFDITSACYVESFGKMLFGTSTGKIMEFYTTTPRTDGSIAYMSHQWRDNGSASWSETRSFNLSDSSDLNRQINTKQCGIYRSRQHKVSYQDDTANGGTFRCEFTTGNITHKTNNRKRADGYEYDVKRGHDREFILNKVQEDVTGLAK